MAQSSFEAQIDTRQAHDERVLGAALADLVRVLDPERTDPAGTPEAALARLVAQWPPRRDGDGDGDGDGDNQADASLEEQFDRWLRPAGIMWRQVRLEGAWWRDALGCLLARTTDGQPTVLRPGRFRGYSYNEGKGRVNVTRRTAGRLQPEAFCFYRPLPPTRLGLGDLVRFMAASVSPVEVALVTAASLAVALLGTLFPYLTRALFAWVVPAGMSAMLAPVGALLMGAAAAAAVLGMTRSVLLHRLQVRIGVAVQSAAMMRLLGLPLPFFRNYPVGELAERLRGVTELAEILTGAALTTLLSGVASLVYLFQIRQFAPDLLFPAVAVLAVSVGHTALVTWQQLGISRRRLQAGARLNSVVYGLLAGIQKIKLAGAGRRAFARWAEAYAQLGRLEFAPPVYLRLTDSVALLISGLGAVWLAWLAGRTRVGPADFIAFQAAFGAVAGAVQSLAGVAGLAARAKPILEMAEPLLSAVPEAAAARHRVTSLGGAIAVSNLSFRYGPDGPLILDGVSLSLRPGEFVALVGRTGCGKTTLVRLLLGFEAPLSGAIEYDGHPLAELDLPSLRRRIGSALQNGSLLPGSIGGNILLGAPWLGLEEAWEAARLAGVDEDIRAMPMGMQTAVREGGGGISGGQRQRLLIARALVTRPAVLFLDEATSALDNITQQQVAANLAALRCTRLVIAHRLSTVRHSDRILVLERGRIVEEGRYEDLMAQGGLFCELVRRQTL